MIPADFCRIAARLMRCPTAPYHESAVRRAAEKVCAEFGLPAHRDRFGNLWIGRPAPGRARQLVLAAHLDHPGFELAGKPGSPDWRARFQGGVPERYFRKGTRIRLEPGNLRARLGPRLETGMEFIIEPGDRARRPFPTQTVAPQFAMWDLRRFERRGNRIRGCACDDLIGAAMILSALKDLRGSPAGRNAIGILARAEEVGFHGALAVAGDRLLPRNALVVSLETSKEIPPVKIGRGPIIRVGDRASIFDSTATRFLTEVAGDLARRPSGFQFQRALMSGGTCEGTAYQEFGYQTAALCVALGNYHNCGPGGRIAAEYVDVRDCCQLVALLVEASGRLDEFKQLAGRLPARLRQMLAEARPALIRTAFPARVKG